MKAPSHLSRQAKTIFRNLVDQLKALDHLHAVDIYQVERASILIEQGRAIHSLITPAMDLDELERVNRLISSNTVSLNSTLDKLGISYTKRNPYKEKRGRPVKGTKTADDDTPNDWEKILADVPVATGPRKAN